MPVGRFDHRGTGPAVPSAVGHYADFLLKRLTSVLEGRSMSRLDRTAHETGHAYSAI